MLHPLGAGIAQNNAFNPASLANAPRELGLIDRASGLAAGLSGLRSRLEDLQSRIEGLGPSSVGSAGAATPDYAGLPGFLSDAEGQLRACMAILDALNERF